MIKFTLEDFVRESNRIERILRDPTEAEINAHKEFLDLSSPMVHDMEKFVSVVQPDAVIRSKPGLDVVVGLYSPPRGSPYIVDELEHILLDVPDAYEQHVAYETLHPFTDGNGRSGRVLWLWGMGGIERVPLGFLHTFYYQTLSRSHYSWLQT